MTHVVAILCFAGAGAALVFAVVTAIVIRSGRAPMSEPLLTDPWEVPEDDGQDDGQDVEQKVGQDVGRSQDGPARVGTGRSSADPFQPGQSERDQSERDQSERDQFERDQFEGGRFGSDRPGADRRLGLVPTPSTVISAELIGVEVHAWRDPPPPDGHVVLVRANVDRAADAAPITSGLAEAVRAALAQEPVDQDWTAVTRAPVTTISATPATWDEAIDAGADACQDMVAGRPLEILGTAAEMPRGPLSVVHAIGVSLPLPDDRGVAHLVLAVQVTGIVIGVTSGMLTATYAALGTVLDDEVTAAVTAGLKQVPGFVTGERRA